MPDQSGPRCRSLPDTLPSAVAQIPRVPLGKSNDLWTECLDIAQVAKDREDAAHCWEGIGISIFSKNDRRATSCFMRVSLLLRHPYVVLRNIPALSIHILR